MASSRKPAPKPAALPPHRLDRAIPYLVARAGERMGMAFSKELRPFKLTLNEWRACAALQGAPHQRLSDLGDRIAADPSTLSRVVDGLIKRGLVKRDRSTTDARALALSLTPEGVALTEKIIPLAQLYERIALAGISEEEAEMLRGLLARIYDNVTLIDR
jgi:DNA-binding MarR family transcriptional regulator